jgi:hypothetical protein
MYTNRFFGKLFFEKYYILIIYKKYFALYKNIGW